MPTQRKLSLNSYPTIIHAIFSILTGLLPHFSYRVIATQLFIPLRQENVVNKYNSVLLLCLFLSAAIMSSDVHADAASAVNATITKVSDDKIVVDEDNVTKGATYSLSSDMQQQLASKKQILSTGDKVILEFDNNKNVTGIKAKVSLEISSTERLMRLGGSIVALLVAFFILGWLGSGKMGGIAQVVLGEDNRYSNSKFQMALWFFVVIAAYLAVVWLRAANGACILVNIPQNLLLLSGMSVLTFGGAKVITSGNSDPTATKKAADAKAEADSAKQASEAAKRDDASNAEDLKTKAENAASNAKSMADDKGTGKKSYNSNDPQFWKDLLQNDHGKADFGDFQMLVVTFLAICVYGYQIYEFMAHVDMVNSVMLPDVDTTILSVFGLGQGAYLAKKAAGQGVS